MTEATALPIERFRKKPLVVDTMLWDGTTKRLFEIRAWLDLVRMPLDTPLFLYNAEWGLRLWNDQEGCYVDCPVGHRVVRGALDEFYPISPDAVAETYEAVDR